MAWIEMRRKDATLVVMLRSFASEGAGTLVMRRCPKGSLILILLIMDAITLRLNYLRGDHLLMNIRSHLHHFRSLLT